MDNKKLFKCIGLIEDKFLEEAEDENVVSQEHKKRISIRRKSIMKMCLVAASFIILVSAGLWTKFYKHNSNGSATKTNKVIFLYDLDTSVDTSSSKNSQEKENNPTFGDGDKENGNKENGNKETANTGVVAEAPTTAATVTEDPMICGECTTVADTKKQYNTLTHIDDYHFYYRTQDYYIVSCYSQDLLEKKNLPTHIEDKMIGKKIGTYDFVLNEFSKKMKNVKIYEYKKDKTILLIKDNQENWYYAISTH